MTYKDLIEETTTAIVANPARTGLTILGIVIGIASVIVMLAIGNGAQASISASINALGSNILTISGGGGNRTGGVNLGRSNQQTLTLEDAKAIRDTIVLAKDVSPELTSRAQVIAISNNTNTTIAGVVPEYASAHSVSMESGDFISDMEYKSSARVAVLGPTTRNDLFGTSSDAVGEEIKINGTKFVVVGITQAKGGSGFGSVDDRVFIPLSSAERYISGGQYINAISVTSENQSDLAQMQSDITELLLQRHNKKSIADADFNILNQQDLANTAQSVTQIFTILLSSVAGISLLVGGIGIMNMMLTNVRERTREIGLRKAIGARRKDINNQFLAESIVVTVVGGVIGVVLGLIISFTISGFGLLQTKVTLSPVALAFGVSVVIGIVFGYYPAKKAAELNPIEALRYE